MTEDAKMREIIESKKPLRRLAFEAYIGSSEPDEEQKYVYERDEYQWERVAQAIASAIREEAAAKAGDGIGR